jgi:hypothetical protein
MILSRIKTIKLKIEIARRVYTNGRPARDSQWLKKCAVKGAGLQQVQLPTDERGQETVQAKI